MNGALTHTWLRRVSDYCSGGVSATERAAVEAHLATCATCREALATYRRFDTRAQSLLWLGDGAVGVLPGYRPALQEETMITKDSNREPGTMPIRPRRPPTALTTLGAIAAVLLVAILAGALFAHFRSPTQPGTGTAPFVHVVSTSRQVLAGDAAPTVATCPAGEVALSGGWDVPAAGSVLASHRMGNGWGIVVQAPTGSGVSVTASVACLAHVPGATVQELSSSVTVASGTSNYPHVDCPRSAVGAIGGGFSTSSPQLDFAYFYWDMGSLTTWTTEVRNSGPSAATVTLFAECLTASGVRLAPDGMNIYNATVPQGGEQTFTAGCPQGSFASGGGLIGDPPQPGNSRPTVRILGLAPASKGSGWSADLSAVGGAITAQVLVVCLSLS